MALALNLEPCFAPVERLTSNGMAFAGSLGPMAFARSPFVKTFKRDTVRVNPIPNAAAAIAAAADWMKDYNSFCLYSQLGSRSPCAYLRAMSQLTACPV